MNLCGRAAGGDLAQPMFVDEEEIGRLIRVPLEIVAPAQLFESLRRQDLVSESGQDHDRVLGEPVCARIGDEVSARERL